MLLETAATVNTNTSHCITSSAHMCSVPSPPPRKRPSLPPLQKKRIWNSLTGFIFKKKKERKKYGLRFLKQTATLIMMNLNTTQFSQMSTFTPQFLEADDTSVTSGLANHVSKLLELGSTYALHFTREQSKPQSNTVHIFWSINFIWKF